jgi:hypothetical protein
MSDFDDLSVNAPWRNQLWDQVRQQAAELLRQLNQKVYEGKGKLEENASEQMFKALTTPNVVLHLNRQTYKSENTQDFLIEATLIGLCVGHEKPSLGVYCGDYFGDNRLYYHHRTDIVFEGSWPAVQSKVVEEVSAYVRILRDQRVAVGHFKSESAPPLTAIYAADEEDTNYQLKRLGLPIVGIAGVWGISSWASGMIEKGGLIASLTGFVASLLFLWWFLYWIWLSARARAIRKRIGDPAIVTAIVLVTTGYLFPYALAAPCFEGNLNTFCFSRPSEEKPPVGRDHVLESSQIRYCLAESIRIDAAKGALNNSIGSDVDEFNATVEDWNSRCAQYKYDGESFKSAKSEIEGIRSRLQSEGRSRFSP